MAIVAMTVGLIRGESARDMRTMTATGASAHTRRAITASTAGALAVLGVVVAAATADAALVAAFEDHHFDAGKKNQSYWRRCDHQCVQDTYAGSIVPAKTRHSAYEFLEIAESVPDDAAAGSCDTPDARAAGKNIATHPILHRPDYSAVSLR